MSFFLTDTTLKHNPPLMPVRLARSFSPSRDSLHPMRCSSRTGAPKARQLSPSRHGNISSHQGGQDLQRPPRPHPRPPHLYRPPTTPPHPQRVITTITPAMAWKRRTACGAGAASGQRATTAVTGAARSPQCRCGNCPASRGFLRLRARRAAPSRTRTTRVMTRTVRRSRLARATTARVWHRARRRPGLGDSRLGSSSSNSRTSRRNKRRHNARRTWGRRTRSSRV